MTTNNVPSYDRVMTGPYQSATSVSASTPVTPGIAIDVTCTTTGTITLTMADGSTMTRAFPVGSTFLPYAVSEWVVASGAVVTEFYNLD